jgi:hypothetical protein
MIRQGRLLDLQQENPAFAGSTIASDGSTVVVPNEQIMQNILGLEPSTKRIMVGNHGVYVEHGTPQAFASGTTQPIVRRQYDEYRANGIKYYKQTKNVNYAEYKPGEWYSAVENYFGTNPESSQPQLNSSVPIFPNPVTTTPERPRISEAQERHVARLLDDIKKYNPDDARTIQQFIYTDPNKIRLVIYELEQTKKAAEARAAAMKAPQEIQSLPSFEEFALPAERSGSAPTIDYKNRTKAMVEKLGITVDPSWYETSGNIQRLYNAIKNYQSTESNNTRVAAEQARRLEVEAANENPIIKWRPTPTDIRSVQTMLINPVVAYLGYRKGSQEYEEVDKAIKLLGDSGNGPMTPRQRALIMNNLGKLGLKTFNQPVDDPSKYKNIDSSWLLNKRNAHMLILMLNSMAAKSSQATSASTSEAEYLQSAPEVEV